MGRVDLSQLDQSAYAEQAMPEIIGRCKICSSTWKARTYPRTAWIVSPQGREHIGSEYGMTLCGHDATGPNWWWPL